MDTLIHHYLRKSACIYPDKVAIVQGEQAVTFEQLDRMSDRVASALVRHGISRLDRVCSLLEKSIEEVLAFLGASKAGGVFVPINHLLFAHQVEHIVNDCRPTVLVTTRRRWTDLRPVLERLGVRESLLEEASGIRARRVWANGTLPSDAATQAAAPPNL